LTRDAHSYDAAGVSLDTAESVVDRLRAAVESTGARGFGAFAGLHPLGDGRFLAASTDGVGTKLILARERGRLRTCGADLAAHCINDVATCGAEPLMLLDYVAANTIKLEEVVELVEGAAEVCRAAGVALVGGETAELPGIYAAGQLDFAGTCVGVVAEPLDGSTVAAGDTVIGFASAGVHANGFTLVPACSRRRTTTAPTWSPRRRSTSTSRVRSAGGRRRSHTSRAAASSAICSGSSRANGGSSSTGKRGSGRRCSTGSRGTSTRRSCAACSTSASAGARSWPSRSPARR